MDHSLFKYIFRYSRTQQIALLILTVCSFPFLYLSLDLPKIIINNAIGGDDSLRDLYGFELTQIQYLWVLCGAFLALVFVNGAFKYVINLSKGILAERMLRRLRFMLVDRLLRFPMGRFRAVGQGEVVAMVTAETEAVGGFIGDAFVLPVFQGGILLTILTFMFVQDPILGIAAISLYPIQAWLIPKLQRLVTQLNKERVRNVRKLSERLGETVAGVGDIHAHDTSRYELADYGGRLGVLFKIRYKAYRIKFFIKFLNNFLAQLTPFFFYAIGGYLVIKGDLSFGALVAVLAAYKDLSAPWKELLNYYQRMEDARVKYTQVVEGFDPPDLLSSAVVGRLSSEEIAAGNTEHLGVDPDKAAAHPRLSGPLQVANLVLDGDDGRLVDNVTLTIPEATHVALVGPSGGGRSELARLLGRQIFPSGGTIGFGADDLLTLPETVTGRDTAYLDSDAFIRAGTMRDALFYGLKHRPLGDAAMLDGEALSEAKASGNTQDALEARWVSVPGSDGADSAPRLDESCAMDPALRGRVIEILTKVGLIDDVFDMGLRCKIDQPEEKKPLADQIMTARQELSDLLEENEVADLVEHFDPDRYLYNATVAENILFGAPEDDSFHPDVLGNHPVMRATLAQMEMETEMIDIGLHTAGLMVDLFRDLPPGHAFFDRFSFFPAEDIPDFQRMLNATKGPKGHAALSTEDKERVMGLSFRLVPAQHRLGILDEGRQARILEARSVFQTLLEKEQCGGVAFFQPGAFNPAATVRENILYGKIAFNKEGANSQVRDVLREVVERLDLFDTIVTLGLETDVGVAGKRLSSAQRQLLVLARALLKDPALLVLNEPFGSLDRASREKLLARVREDRKEASLIWVDGSVEEEDGFDHVFELARGRAVELGATEAAPGTATEAEPDVEAVAETPEVDEELAALEPSAVGISAEARLLSNVPFFAGLDASTLKLMAFTGDRKSYASGDVIMRQGELGEYAYVLMEGQAQVVLETETGPRVLADRGPGDLVGELALLCEAPRTATVVAVGKVEALRISSEIFFRLIQDNAQVSATLLRIVSKRLESSMRDVSGGRALYDPETGLPNGDMFIGRLRSALKRHGAAPDGDADPSIPGIVQSREYDVGEGPAPLSLPSGTGANGLVTGVVLIRVIDWDGLLADLPEGSEQRLFKKLIRRFRGAMMESDLLARLERPVFAVMVHGNSETVVAQMRDALSGPLRFGRKAVPLGDRVQVTLLDPREAEQSLGGGE